MKRLEKSPESILFGQLKSTTENVAFKSRARGKLSIKSR